MFDGELYALVKDAETNEEEEDALNEYSRRLRERERRLKDEETEEHC